MKTRPFLLHALTPLHAGTGQSVGVIDLPLARARATGAPLVPGSSIKGVLRDASPANREAPAAGTADEPDWQRSRAVFGPDTERAADHAGALAVTDARLLALPVRSYKGTFAWVTSPLLLHGVRRDLGAAAPAEVPEPRRSEGPVAAVASDRHRCVHRGMIFLEDLDLAVDTRPEVAAWADWLAAALEPEEAGRARVAERFVVVDDETMTFLYETAMQIDTRIRLDPETRTVDGSALWTEESLPPESVLFGLLVAERSRRAKVSMDPAAVLDFALGEEKILQFGGKATVGRGRCRMVPLGAEGGR